MLTAQRFQLSVPGRAGAERWPPISPNTRSPQYSLSLSLSPSLLLPLSLSIYHFFSLFFSHPSSQAWLTAHIVPACQRGAVFLLSPSGTGEWVHTYTPPRTCTVTEHAFTKASYTRTQQTPTHAVFLPHGRKYFSSAHGRDTRIKNIYILTAFGECSACCQRFWEICWGFACTNQDQEYYPHRQSFTELLLLHGTPPTQTSVDTDSSCQSTWLAKMYQSLVTI